MFVDRVAIVFGDTIEFLFQELERRWNLWLTGFFSFASEWRVFIEIWWRSLGCIRMTEDDLAIFKYHFPRDDIPLTDFVGFKCPWIIKQRDHCLTSLFVLDTDFIEFLGRFGRDEFFLYDKCFYRFYLTIRIESLDGFYVGSIFVCSRKIHQKIFHRRDTSLIEQSKITGRGF